MRLDCSVADLSSPSRTVVEHDSVNTLVLLHDRLTLNSENLKANLQQDPEVENSSSNNRLTEDSGAKVAKEETFEVDTSDDEQGGASTGYSSSSDESYPASPVSKAITPAFINTTAFQFEHCLYFYRAPYHYCWGVCVGSQSESRVCRVHLGQDGNPVLEICDIISTTGSGASSRWNGLHFHHPNLFERKIYEPTGIVDMYQTLPAYPEYQDLVAHYPIPNAGGITNTDVPLQAIEPLHLGDIALPDNIPQQFFGVPDEPNQAPHQGNFNMHAQEAPGVNAGNSAFSLSIGNGAKYITLADRNMVTIAAIEEFVDGNLSHNRQRELIMCHVCTGPKRDMPRPDNRPYALKEHLKTHYFKVRCMWCSQAYSNKANLIKNHSNCPNAPAGITTETDRYTYVPRT